MERAALVGVAKGVALMVEVTVVAATAAVERPGSSRAAESAVVGIGAAVASKAAVATVMGARAMAGEVTAMAVAVRAMVEAATD